MYNESVEDEGTHQFPVPEDRVARVLEYIDRKYGKNHKLVHVEMMKIPSEEGVEALEDEEVATPDQAYFIRELWESEEYRLLKRINTSGVSKRDVFTVPEQAFKFLIVWDIERSEFDAFLFNTQRILDYIDFTY